MKQFRLTIHGHREEFEVDAYEPFDGAAFVVHRARYGNGHWVVSHIGTTWIAHHPDINTRKSAIEIADRLSRECPLASDVKVDAKGKLVGPVHEFREQIVSVLQRMGETTRAAA